MESRLLGHSVGYSRPFVVEGSPFLSQHHHGADWRDAGKEKRKLVLFQNTQQEGLKSPDLNEKYTQTF